MIVQLAQNITNGLIKLIKRANTIIGYLTDTNRTLESIDKKLDKIIELQTPAQAEEEA